MATFKEAMEDPKKMEEFIKEHADMPTATREQFEKILENMLNIPPLKSSDEKNST